jgi:putative tricarboxylic transport membrane protein
MGFGVLGFVLREMKYPMAPPVLGIILGDLLDKNLRRGLVLTGGDITPFFTRPLCLFLWLITFISMLMTIEPTRRGLQRKYRASWPGRNRNRN